MIRAAALVLPLLAAAAAAQGGDPESRARKAVVRVVAEDRGVIRARELLRARASQIELRGVRIRQPYTFVTSGVVISPHGEIVTPALHPRADLHVVVTLHDGTSEVADVIGTDPRSNLALLRVPRETPAHLALHRERPHIRQPVDLVGCTSLAGIVASGIVAQEKMAIQMRDLYGVTGGPLLRLPDVFAVTSTIGRPAAGAACVDLDGRLLGLVCGTTVARVPKVEQPGAAAAVEFSFVIPAARVARVLDCLRRDGRVPRAYYGLHLEPVSETVRAQLDLGPGVAAVAAIEADGPAFRAGLEPHDIVLEVGGRRCDDPYALGDALDESPPREAVELKILRAGAPLAVSITPDER